MVNQKIENLLAAAHLKELMHKKEMNENKKNTLIWILAIIGAVAAIAGIAFAVFKYFTPNYLEDDFDDFDDDFDDDFFTEDDIIEIDPKN